MQNFQSHCWPLQSLLAGFSAQNALRHSPAILHYVFIWEECTDSISNPALPSVSRATDSIGGLPVCRWCSKKFSQWPAFELHIAGGSCPVREQIDMSTQPCAVPSEALQYSSIAKQLCEDTCMEQLDLSAKTLYSLANHCVICHQWSGRPTSLSKHVGTHLSAELKINSKAEYAKLTHQVSFHSPCTWCSKPFKEQHTCLVYWQRAVLRAYLESQQHGCQDDRGTSPAVDTRAA